MDISGATEQPGDQHPSLYAARYAARDGEHGRAEGGAENEAGQGTGQGFGDRGGGSAEAVTIPAAWPLRPMRKWRNW